VVFIDEIEKAFAGTLAGVKKALAVDDATSPMDGSLVPASPGQLSRFKKLSD
jgi:hypothetical protein